MFFFFHFDHAFIKCSQSIRLQIKSSAILFRKSRTKNFSSSYWVLDSFILYYNLFNTIYPIFYTFSIERNIIKAHALIVQSLSLLSPILPLLYSFSKLINYRYETQIHLLVPLFQNLILLNHSS